MSDRPRLLILSLSPVASDARVLKQVRGFADLYDVTTCGFGPGAVEGVRHLEITRRGRGRWRERFPRASSRYGDVLAVLRRYARLYASNSDVAEGWQLLRGEEFDAVLVNDLDAVPLALWVCEGARVHADLHEYWPRLREDSTSWRLVRGPYYSWLCRRYLPQCASATTVGRGIADEYAKQFGVSCGVVQNAAPFMDLPVGEVASPLRLVHSGVADRTRGLERLIEAARTTTTEVTLDLFLIPGPDDLMAELHAQAAASGGRVTIWPPVPYDELIQRLNGFDVGVYLLKPATFNHAWALPNKIFDFIQARLGLIVGPSPEMADVVRASDLGVVTEGFEASDLTRVLDSVTADDVRAWKAHSAAAASALSAEKQQHVWEDAVARILNAEGVR